MLVLWVIIISLVIFIAYMYLFRSGMNSERHFNNSTSIYNIVTAIGIITAGVWAFSTFDLLHQRDIAQEQLIDLKKKSKSIESSKIELHTEVVDYKGYSLEDDDEKKEEAADENKGLIVKVKITNVGDKAIEFDLSNSPMKIYEIAVHETSAGYLKLYKPIIYSEIDAMGGKKGNTPLNKFISLTGSERELNYFLVLPINRMYYIVFSTESDHISDDDVISCKDTNSCKWFVSKYIYLE